MPGLVPPAHDERENLLGFLAQQRPVLKLTAFGLTDEEARRAATVSTLTVGGLIKHVANVERNWVDTILQDRSMSDEIYADSFTMRDDETLAEVIAEYDAVATRTSEVIAAIDDLGRPVPVPQGVPWFPDDVEAWSVRWVLAHLIQETARHAGHADLVRESVDGATAYPLMAAAENWPATPWMSPWRRAD